MSVASRLRKQRKTNVWPFVLAGGGLVVFLLVAAVIVVASANSRGNIAVGDGGSPAVTKTGGWGFSIPGMVSVPERDIVLRAWFHPEHKEDFYEIVRWSRPYHFPQNRASIKFRLREKSTGSVDTYSAWMEDGKLTRVAYVEPYFANNIEWAEPGMENVPVVETED